MVWSGVPGWGTVLPLQEPWVQIQIATTPNHLPVQGRVRQTAQLFAETSSIDDLFPRPSSHCFCKIRPWGNTRLRRVFNPKQRELQPGPEKRTCPFSWVRSFMLLRKLPTRQQINLTVDSPFLPTILLFEDRGVSGGLDREKDSWKEWGR